MIQVENGMQEAWETGCNGYQPSFGGETLAVECCEPQVSLENLLTLLEAGLRPTRYRANADRSILVDFADGGSYLATGFSFGEPGPATAAFAEFVAAAHGEVPGLSRYEHFLAIGAIAADIMAEDGLIPLDGVGD